MRMVTGIIGSILLTLAIIHAFIPHSSALTFILLYASAAICAFATLYFNMHLILARVFAVGTTAVMFFCFAVFFKMAPHFHEEWYRSGAALEGVGMLLSAFAMIPVLSYFSCMLKAECRETLERDAGGSNFFSVPDSVPPDITEKVS
jgi:hypothetical protein